MSRKHAPLMAQRAVHGQRGGNLKKGPSAGAGSIADPASQCTTIALALLSSAVFSLVIADGDPRTRWLAWIACQGVTVGGAAWWLRRRAVTLGDTLVVSPLVVLAGLLALAWETASRCWLDSGLPFELLTMSVVRNLVLALAIVSAWPVYQRLCIVLSLFLAMFGMTASRNAMPHWPMGLFALGAVCWMVVSHWENIRRRLHGREQSRGPRWILFTPLLVVLLFGVLFTGSNGKVMTTLRGFMPSSGGTGASDPYARGGVGDGEMLIAGTENIQSFAPIEDAPFMQDDQPSLYDLFDDTYEEEVRKPQTDRAVPLPPELASRAREHVHNRTEKAQREFSTLRKKPKSPARRSVEDIRSNALFYVAGRVPLHLRLHVYDLFDGVSWYPEELTGTQSPLVIRNSNNKPWLQLKDLGEDREYLGPAETHAIKVVNIDTNIIPAPLYLHGVHIDLVDRPEMFRHGPEGLVGLVSKTLPSLVPIHLATRSIDWEKLPSESPSFRRLRSERATSVIPNTIDARELKRLATQWSEGMEPGWAQIDAVRRHLHDHFTLDPDWRPTHGEVSPVQEFLFSSHRGPDYQFATAAALLLRSLGYTTRVVSGFYADARKYDHASRHTPITAQDVHFWTEVRIGGSDWVTLEPSPGYDVLGPPPGVWQQCRNAIASLASWCLQHWMLCAVACIAGVLLVQYRLALADVFATIRWRWVLWLMPDDAVVETLQLLQYRAALSGNRRAPSATYRSWLGELMALSGNPSMARPLYELRRSVDLAAYGGRSASSMLELVPVCRTCVRSCTLRWFRMLRVANSDTVLATATPRTVEDYHARFAGQR